MILGQNIVKSRCSSIRSCLQTLQPLRRDNFMSICCCYVSSTSQSRTMSGIQSGARPGMLWEPRENSATFRQHRLYHHQYRSIASSLTKISPRSFSTTRDSDNNNINTDKRRQPANQAVMEEQTLISRLSPLKRIVCLCPVPLGRGRISWSGGDYCGAASNEANALANNADGSSSSYPDPGAEAPPTPVKVTRYRYGERYAIGVAVSDPYLTHAVPVDVSDGFVAEMVPTFRCDVHNMGTSPIFHTNLPYFRHDFLRRIGHFDIGAIVVALPMKSSPQSTPPFCPTPSSLQSEQTLLLEHVRHSLLGVLQNYMTSSDSGNDDEYEEEIEEGGDNHGFFENVYVYDGMQYGDFSRQDNASPNNFTNKQTTITTRKDNNSNSNDNSAMINETATAEAKENKRKNAVSHKKHRCSKPLGPLNLQGYIDHRLSIDDVEAKFNEYERRGNWDDIAKALQEVQSQRYHHYQGRTNYNQSANTNDDYSNTTSKTTRRAYYRMEEYHQGYQHFNANLVIPPELHAAVALNAMIETYTGGSHNSFF